MKKLILWDLDGTLIDTLEDLGKAVNHALAVSWGYHSRDDLAGNRIVHSVEELRELLFY